MFHYFLPTPKKALLAEDLVAAGLAHALDDRRSVNCLHTFSGPGDSPGVVCTVDDKLHPAYKPAEQTWRKGPGGKYWVGMAKGAKTWGVAGGDVGSKSPTDSPLPTPHSQPATPHSPPATPNSLLARSRQYPGQPVTLLDGNEWLVPRCHGILEDRPAMLPRVLDLADDGETAITRVHPRFARLCEDAARFWMQFCGILPDADRLSPDQLVQLAVDALAVNYRVGKTEVVALLGLFDTDSYGKVLRAAIDADEIEAHFKQQQDGQKKST